MSVPIQDIVAVNVFGGGSSTISSTGLTLMVLAQIKELEDSAQSALTNKVKEYTSIASVQSDANESEGAEIIAIASAFFANRGKKLKIYFSSETNAKDAYQGLKESTDFYNALICSNSYTITNVSINDIVGADEQVIFGFTATENNYDDIQTAVSTRPMTHLSYATTDSISSNKSNVYIFAALAGLYSSINRNGIKTDRSAEYLIPSVLTPSIISLETEKKLTEKGTTRITTLASSDKNIMFKGTKMANSVDFLQVTVAKLDFTSKLQETGFNLLASVLGVPYDVNGYSKLINAVKNDCIQYNKNGCFVPMVSSKVQELYPSISDNQKISLMNNGFSVLVDGVDFNPTQEEKNTSKMPSIPIAVNFGKTASVVEFTLDVRGE